MVPQGAPPVPSLRVPKLLWQSGPAWTGLVRSLGTELIIQDPATGIVVERVSTPGVPAYFGVTGDGAVLCVATEQVAIDPARPKLTLSPRKQLAGWSLRDRRWLWTHEDSANGLLIGTDRCGFLRNVGTADARGNYAHELVVRRAQTGEPIGEPQPLRVSGVSRTTLQISPDGKWAVYPATTQLGYADGQAPAWTLYRLADLTIAMWWSGPCASFDAHGVLTLDAASRTQRGSKLTELGLASAVCTPMPLRFDPARLFAPAPDASLALTMLTKRDGIELATRERTGAIKATLTNDSEVASVAVTRDGSRAFVVEGGTLREWNLTIDSGPRELATNVVAGPYLDRDTLTLGWIADGALQRREVVSGRELAALPLPALANVSWRVALGPGTSAAALATGAQQTLLVTDSQTWRTIPTRAVVRTLSFAADRLIVLDRDGVRAWSAAGKAVGRQKLTALALAVSDDGGTIATTTARAEGTQVVLADAVTLGTRTTIDAALLSYSIKTLGLDASEITIAGAPTLDGCDAERCFVETIAIDRSRPPELVVLDGLGPVSFISKQRIVQAAVDRRGVRVMSADGHTQLTFGSIGGGWFAYEPHGHYACSGEGCAAFRCSSRGAVTEVTTCERDRVAGISKLLDIR